MKRVTYHVLTREVRIVNADYIKELSRLKSAFNKNPEYYGGKTANDLIGQWKKLARNKSIFNQLVRDELSSIKKEKDDFYSWDDHKGDMYCPIVNSDIDKKELKRQETNERARFNKGVYGYQLMVDDIEFDSIYGFIGNDFYGSGYDNDFYQNAIAQVTIKHPEYIYKLQGVNNG